MIDTAREKRVIVFSSVNIHHKSGTLHNILLQYLKGFIASGYRVNLVLDSRAILNAEKIPEALAEKINITRILWAERFYILPVYFYQRFRSILKHFCFKKALGDLGESRGIWSKQRNEAWKVPYVIILTTQFLFHMLFYGRNASFIYSVEPTASVSGGIVGRFLGMVSVSRIMGSAIYNIDIELKSRWKSRFKYPIRHISLSPLSILHVMTDDGTNGLQALLDHGVNPRQIWFKKNGIPQIQISEIANENSLSDEYLPYFVTVSRLVDWKRVDRCLKIFEGVLSKFTPEKSLKLLVIGDGPEEDFLKKYAASMGIERDVIFLGRVSHDKVINIVSKSIGLLSLYNYSNLTNQVLEAVAVSVPVITYEGLDVADLLVDGVNSILLSRELPLEVNAGRVINQLNVDPSLRRLKNTAASLNASLVQCWEERMSEEISWIEKQIAGRQRTAGRGIEKGSL